MNPWIIVAIIFTLVGWLAMGLAWFLKVRRSGSLLMSAAIAGAVTGGMLAQAGSAMASSVDPKSAFLQGALRGLVFSSLGGLILLGVIRRLNKRGE